MNDDLRALFPVRPDVRATWAPIYLEPMLGSGERLTAAIVCIGHNNTFQIQVTLRARILKCMYGDAGTKVLGLAQLVAESMVDHLALGGKVGDWVPPTKSCFLGPARTALGDSLESVIRQAARLTSSTSGADLEEIDPPDVDAHGVDVERWLHQVKASVVARAKSLESRFNGEVSIRAGAAPTRIGYLGDRIAANFDALIPGSNLSMRRARSKSRLVDLQILRDIDLLQRNSYELLLWVPQPGSPQFTQRALDAANGARLEIEEFADKHGLRVIGFTDAELAADRILSAELAGQVGL